MSSSFVATLGSLAQEIGGQLTLAADPNTPVLDYHVRAWSCRNGSVFIPLEFEDLLQGGNEMVPRAVARGAVCAIVDTLEGLDPNLPAILVDDVAASARLIAENSRARFTGSLIGITGTAGKSSVKAMLGHILRQHAETWVTSSNQNLTPHVTASLAGIHPETNFAVMEIALYKPDTIKNSAKLARPNIGLITSIGLNHAEDFQDPHEGILQAKLDLVRHCETNGIAVLPRFSDRFRELLVEVQRCKNIKRIITCGENESDDVRLVRVEQKSEQYRATIMVDGDETSFDVPYLGRHMVENAVMVAGAVVALGLPIDLMSHISTAPALHSAIQRYRIVYQGRRVELINDSFNTGPLAVQAMTQQAAKRKDTRKLLLMSDIGGLVDKQDEIHQSLITDIEAAGFTHVFTVGAATKKMSHELSCDTSNFNNRFEATKALQSMLEDGDLVFIKGTTAMKFKDVINHLKKSCSIMERVGPEWINPASQPVDNLTEFLK